MELKDPIVEEARMGMYGRILRCPLKVMPEDCPLRAIRTMPVIERIEWMESRTDQEIVELYQHHTKCIAKNSAEKAD